MLLLTTLCCTLSIVRTSSAVVAIVVALASVVAEAIVAVVLVALAAVVAASVEVASEVVVLVAASEAQAECKNNKNPAQAERDLLFYWRCMSPLLFSVVDVVALCGSHLFLEVGNAGFDEDVVPLDELLDVRVLYAVLIPLGQYL